MDVCTYVHLWPNFLTFSDHQFNYPIKDFQLEATTWADLVLGFRTHARRGSPTIATTHRLVSSNTLHLRVNVIQFHLPLPVKQEEEKKKENHISDLYNCNALT